MAKCPERNPTSVLTVRLPVALMTRLEDVLTSEKGWRYASRTHLVQCALREWLDARERRDAMLAGTDGGDCKTFDGLLDDYFQPM